MSQLSSKPHLLCQFFYELALWLTLSFLCLLPLHSSFEKHFNINRIIDSSSVAFNFQGSSPVRIGETFPIYRFNPQLTVPIGQVKVSSIEGNEIIASYDFKDFKWPMGRHGRVLELQGSKMKVDMGWKSGFKTGDFLCLFKDRTMVGKIQLQEVNQEDAFASILSLNAVFDKDALTVSEYTVATQAIVLSNPWLPFFELFFIAFMVLLYSYFFIMRRQSLFYLLGDCLRSIFKEFRLAKFSFLFNLVIGIPFVWFFVNFLPRCLFYLIQVLVLWSNRFFHSSIELPNLFLFLNNNSLSIYIIAGAIYLALLIYKERSPIILFWQWVSFKKKEKLLVKGYWRDILIWSLHLIIFYAFGNTLWGFLNGNMNALVQMIWPNSQIPWYQLSAWYQPQVKALTDKEIFSVIRYLLWSVTIVGCMFGYAYSVFGYLWGKKIRDLDFTAMGWITNAICYGPLLGGVIGQMTSGLTGPEPIVTQGPLMYFNMIMETFLNLLYTLSIWNLGNLFGVMTDKGVRTTGFYSVIRHPSYTLEALMFLMIYINGFSSHLQWFAILNISILTYYVRSEREDQFMAASNPQYVTYQSKTPYKFIPGIY